MGFWGDLVGFKEHHGAPEVLAELEAESWAPKARIHVLVACSPLNYTSLEILCPKKDRYVCIYIYTYGYSIIYVWRLWKLFAKQKVPICMYIYIYM